MENAGSRMSSYAKETAWILGWWLVGPLSLSLTKRPNVVDMRQRGTEPLGNEAGAFSAKAKGSAGSKALSAEEHRERGNAFFRASEEQQKGVISMSVTHVNM